MNSYLFCGRHICGGYTNTTSSNNNYICCGGYFNTTSNNPYHCWNEFVYTRTFEEEVEKEGQIENEEEERGLCVICIDQRASIIFHNCGHLCICETCLKDFINDQCPICRQYIGSTQKITLENTKEENYGLCKICTDQQACIVFHNCGHLCICETCFEFFENDQCPICKCISSTQKVFFT